MLKLCDDTAGADIRGLVPPRRPSPVPPGPEGLRTVFARLLCSPARAHLLIRDQPGEWDGVSPDAPAPVPVTTMPPAAALVAV
jgi:hypothetical protein